VTTRSTVLLTGTLALTGGRALLAYVCPTDRVVLWKSSVLHNQHSTPAQVWAQLVRGGAGPIVFRDTVETGFASYHEHWVVLEEADQIWVQSDVGNVLVWLSGAELLAPSGVLRF
jgi:hypothetical protein